VGNGGGKPGTLLIFAGHRFSEWWRQFAGQKGFKSCHRGDFLNLCGWRVENPGAGKI